MNSRLDTLQAAILIEKLGVFAEEIAARQTVAARYGAGLAGRAAATPIVLPLGQSVWAQYVIEHEDRDGLAAHLRTQEIPTAVYYPVPMHRQEPYEGFPQGPGGLPVSDAKADRVIALPMHPYLSPEVQDRIIDAVCGYNG
jgi:dTDP-4-amino-4,6-dideoxygalactose transaminase